jgi:DNA-binding PadR family transcriptional regulator
MDADASAHGHDGHHTHHDPHDHPDGHRGWVRAGGRRGRWLEPFLLRLLADGELHGSALIDDLDGLCLAPDGVDVGMAYRTLRELEGDGLVVSTWVTDDGPPRRTYRLTVEGRASLAEWVAVMRERARLIDAFLAGAAHAGEREGG